MNMEIPRIAGADDLARIAAEPFERWMEPDSILALVDTVAERYGDRPAFTWLPDGDPATPSTTVGFDRLASTVRRTANALHRAGVAPGDAVGILAPNMPQTHAALWGAEIVGQACPINVLLDGAHVEGLIRAAGIRVLVARGPDSPLPIWPRVEALLDAGVVDSVLVIGDEVPQRTGVISLSEALSVESDALRFERRLTPDTPAALFHTGGTTGLPKLARHLHGNQLHTAWSGAAFYGLVPDDSILNGFPLFHVAGAFVYGLAGLVAGAGQVLPTQLGMRNPEFNANYWSFIERHQVSVVAGVPTTLSMLLSTRPAAGQVDSVRVFMTGGSPLPTELAEAVEARFARPVRNIFGMTESAGLIAVEPVSGPRVPGSAGLPLPWTDVHAVRADQDGARLAERCAPGETGVIVIRGPNVSPGYTDQARNAGTFAADGTLVSGDLGHVDQTGRVFVTGRAKDVIIRGAHNIDPAAIEEAAMAHPAVELAAAIGQPDAYAGEVPVVYLSLRAGHEETSDALREFICERVHEPPARPRRVAIVETMPVTAVGKIYKPALRVDAATVAMTAAIHAVLGDPDVFRITCTDAGGHVRAAVALADPAVETSVREALRGFPVEWTLSVE